MQAEIQWKSALHPGNSPFGGMDPGTQQSRVEVVKEPTSTWQSCLPGESWGCTATVQVLPDSLAGFLFGP